MSALKFWLMEEISEPTEDVHIEITEHGSPLPTTGQETFIRQVFAARLLAGHDSPEVEELLFSVLCSAQDSGLRKVVAESLAHRRDATSVPLLQRLWSEPLSEASITLRCFKDTKDPAEVRVICDFTRGIIKELDEGSEGTVSAVLSALKLMERVEGPEVDALFFDALLCSNEYVRNTAFRACFHDPSPLRRDPIRRPSELLANLSMKLLKSIKGNEQAKVLIALKLADHASNADVVEFLESEVHNEVESDALSAALFASLASRGVPETLPHFFAFLRRRRIDPRNTPSVDLQVGRRGGSGGLFHMEGFNHGDSVYLKTVMAKIRDAKKRVFTVDSSSVAGH
jgi:hypothetical protein